MTLWFLQHTGSKNVSTVCPQWVGPTSLFICDKKLEKHLLPSFGLRCNRAKFDDFSNMNFDFKDTIIEKKSLETKTNLISKWNVRLESQFYSNV